MNDTDAQPTGLPPADLSSTAAIDTAFAPAGAATSGRIFDEELRRLLRSRLILVHGLGLTSVLLLLLMCLLIPGGQGVENPSTTPARLLVPITQSLVGLLVLLRFPRLSLPSLRLCELIFFAVHVAFHGFIRFETLANVEGGVENIPLIGFRGLASLQLFTTLGYGVLIPNRLRRSLLIVAVIAAVPLVVIFPAAAINPALREGHVAPLVAQTVFVLAFPAAIAVFAAARASALERRAFDAERRAMQIGQYQLKRKLGEGGMGEVWLAEHALLKRPCAVKFIRPDLAAHPATAARFVREVQAVTALTHLNTVRVYDYGRAEDGAFYFVMEHLDGPTLEQLVRTGGPLEPGRVVHLLRQICGALAEAHAAGLVHRDLKPGNIIVADLGGQRDVAKLLDFGLVHDLSSDADSRLTRTGMVLGTPAYMSPEQAAGDSAVDARGDLYSLGAVAYFALSGRPPFHGMSMGQVLAAHRSEPPPPLEGVPADLAAVVGRCLEKEPGRRFQTAEELEGELGRCE